jgi:glyoxylase-like metal-dependent hydrolase (beta-lactamase superfamily II)
MQPAGAALEIEAARMVSKAAIVGAVDTHFHLDHTFGNLAYAEQLIPIMAHERVKPLMQNSTLRAKARTKDLCSGPSKRNSPRRRMKPKRSAGK